MLVYANSFESSSSATRERILSAAARWLTRKEVPRTSGADLANDGRIQYRSGARVEVVTAEDAERLYALRYVHADSEVTGRDWISEIGIAETDSNPSRISIALRTDEISSRVNRPIQATRPAIVLELERDSLLAETTPGLEMFLLDDEYAAEGLRYSLAVADRKHPYVIISPTPEGTYLGDPEIIRSMVVGLADVVRIPAGADTFLIADVLGKDFAAWRGAINVIFPARQRPELLVPTVKFLPDVLRELEEGGRRIETEILAAVTHRTNRSKFAQHVAPGAVRDRKQRRELSVRKSEAAQRGDLQEWVKILEELNADLEREKDDLAGQLLDEQLAHDDESRRSEEKIDKLQYLNDSLKSQMEALATARGDGDDASLADVRGAVIAAIDGSVNPEQALLIVSKFFPDRIEILPSAFRSAKQSRDFKYAGRVLGLLLKLCGEYYENIRQGGKGDAQARMTFGEAYTARDSEVVENNKRARELRTFDYKGIPVEMMQHLRIGVKPSPTETIRIHFMWDADHKKVIVGHCGPHLDHG